jgi:hypothetical protein
MLGRVTTSLARNTRHALKSQTTYQPLLVGAKRFYVRNQSNMPMLSFK